MVQIGIDIGGTFTDLSAYDSKNNSLIIYKTLSTPKNPEKAVINAIKGAGINLRDISQIVLGTTVGINTVLQRVGSNILFITTKGFEDIPYIQRIDKQYNYNLKWVRPKPFVERRNCLGVEERINANGEIIKPLKVDDKFLSVIRQKIESENIECVAICLLFSYLNPVHELELKKIIEKNFPDLLVVTSYSAAPVWKEYERSSTTIIDAYIKKPVNTFVSNLEALLRKEGFKSPLMLMKSNGGRMLSKSCVNETLQTLLSGLAGGVSGACYFGKICKEKNIITIDMGGTSCDVCIIQKGMPNYMTEFPVEWGIPIITPVIDVNTIGAGGGSIAWIDKGGLLRVGPKSAGSDPGPVCYSKGGKEPTVSDAAIILGYLDPNYLLGGRMKVDKKLAEKAMESLGEKIGLNVVDTSQAIIDIANENMANLIRLVTIDKGLDPREFILLAYGGAGPLFAAEIARMLNIKRVIIPPFPGILSAFGCLASIPRVDKIWTKYYRSDNLDINSIRDDMRNLYEEALDDLKAEGFEGKPKVLRSINMRYLGQNYEIETGLEEEEIYGDSSSVYRILNKFEELHKKLYGFNVEGSIIELIQFNITLVGTAPKISMKKVQGDNNGSLIGSREVYFKGEGLVKADIYDRDKIGTNFKVRGPVIIVEDDSTIVVPPYSEVAVEDNGCLLILND